MDFLKLLSGLFLGWDAQGFETHEHKHIVDTACAFQFKKFFWVNIGGQQFTLGEICALSGDFFLAPDELVGNAKAARVFMDKHGKYQTHADEIPDDDIRAVSPRYYDYATNNYTHFRNGKRKENAVNKCKEFHALAKELARKDFNKALLYEGFALHYLTDLFSAGHMRTPRGAIFFYLRDTIHYHAINANIVAGLVSKVMHDQDNKDGLTCSYVPADKYVIDDIEARQFLSYSIFYGDNYLFKFPRESLRQFMRVILLHILDIMPHRFEFGEMFPAPDVKANFPDDISRRLAQREISQFNLAGLKDYEDFLQWCLPTPIESQPDGRPPLMAVEKGSNDIAWHGEKHNIIKSGWLEMEIGTRSSDKLIEKVTLFIDAYHLYQSNGLGAGFVKGYDIDGNSDLVRKLFDFQRDTFIDWLFSPTDMIPADTEPREPRKELPVPIFIYSEDF